MARLIDADKLEDVLDKHQALYYGDSDYYEGISQGFNLAIYDVKEAPTIDAEPIRHGKWLMSDVYGAYCSECGSAAFEITGSRYSKMKTRYCWQCGARMDAE